MPMSRRAMFWRMVTSSILRRRSRVLIAVLAVAIGATTLSGLVTIAVDVPAQLAREIRSYGANLVVTPAGEGALTDEAVAASTESASRALAWSTAAEPLWASSSDLDTCESAMLESLCASCSSIGAARAAGARKVATIPDTMVSPSR